MPWYGNNYRQDLIDSQVKIWSDISRFVREIDPMKHLLTVHARWTWNSTDSYNSSRKEVTDPSLIDFDMQQNSHLLQECIPDSVRSLKWSVSQSPKMPVINDEVCYENVFDAGPAVIQRALFWISILSGAVGGYTYGATGIWEFTTEDEPDAGLEKVTDTHWGLYAWREAYTWPGSGQLGLSKAFLNTIDWWNIEPHQEWISPAWDNGNALGSFAGGVPRQLRVIYTPAMYRLPKVLKLENDVKYQALFFNPIDGTSIDFGDIVPEVDGSWQIPRPDKVHDWVLILKAK